MPGRTWSIDEWISEEDGGALIECRDEDAVTEALQALADPELRRRHGERNERYVRAKLGDPESSSSSSTSDFWADETRVPRGHPAPPPASERSLGGRAVARDSLRKCRETVPGYA